MSTRRMFAFMVIVAILAGAGAPIRARAQDNPPPVTYYLANASTITMLDPQTASDTVSITASEQLFLGLTDIHPLTNEFTPELMTGWTVSDDGLTWTFTIRNDVPWVRYDPATKSVERLRNIVAEDVAFGIRRACDPRLENYYSQFLAELIVGCEAVFETAPDAVQEDDFAPIGVAAPDDVTLEITLTAPAGYLLSLTVLSIMRPVMPEVIAEHGANWTTPGTIVTNGPFVLAEWEPEVRRVYVRNPHLPDDLRGRGNVERVEVVYVEDYGAPFELYQNHLIDVSPVPIAELEAVRSDPAHVNQIVVRPDQAVFFFGFNQSIPPFDNVHVRRAFSAMIDRERFVQEVRQNRALPMIHFTPPGTFGAVPIDQVGVGYDPDYARAELAAGDYPECEGFPIIEVETYVGAGTWAEFLVESASVVLGCDPDLFTVEEHEFWVTGQYVDPPPQLETLGWGPDYPDADAWLEMILHCNTPMLEPERLRPCSTTDDLLDQAAAESDPATRAALYAEIEERFFGPEGEHPIIPLFMRVDYLLRQLWVDAPLETDGLFGGVHYDWVTVDQAAQLAARGG